MRANLAEVRERIAAAAARAGRDAGDVELVAAGKYVALDGPRRARRGRHHDVGENRAQDLQAKVAAYGDTFTWDFIGHLQSRKVKVVAPLVRLIHSVGTDSVLEQLGRHAPPGLRRARRGQRRRRGGQERRRARRPRGVPRALPGRRSPGLMTMPPRASEPEDSRRWFAALRELAERHDLRALSMGTTQDYEVAVEEGATIVRIGTTPVRD